MGFRRYTKKEWSPTHDSEDPFKFRQVQIQQHGVFKLCTYQYNKISPQNQPWNHTWFQTPNLHWSPHDKILCPNTFNTHSINHPIHRHRYFHQQEELYGMDAINWSTGVRPNRPFQNINSQPSYNVDNIHTFDPRRSRLSEPVEPTEYFKEQLFLARDGTGQNPYARQPPAKTPRGIIDLWIVLLATSVIKPLLDVSGAFVKFIVNTVYFTVLWSVVKPLRSLPRLGNKAEWDLILAVILATQVARWLPNMEGTVNRNFGNEMQEPVYTTNLPAGLAFGTGTNREISVF